MIDTDMVATFNYLPCLEILSLELLGIGTQTHTSGVRMVVKSMTLMDRLPMHVDRLPMHEERQFLRPTFV